MVRGPVVPRRSTPQRRVDEVEMDQRGTSITECSDDGKESDPGEGPKEGGPDALRERGRKSSGSSF